MKLIEHLERISSIAEQHDLAIQALKSHEKHTERGKNYFKSLGLDIEAEKIIKPVIDKFSQNFDRAPNRIRQNTMIMLLAALENFIKALHRSVLTHNPKLLREHRQIALGRLLSLGYEKVLKEEIDREVHGLDRNSIEFKANYFQKQLGIRWTNDPEIIKRLGVLSDLRNQIIHENPDIDVTDDDCSTTNMLCVVIMTQLIINFQKRFPDLSQLMK